MVIYVTYVFNNTIKKNDGFPNHIWEWYDWNDKAIVLTALKKLLRLFFQHRFNFFGGFGNRKATQIGTT